MLPEKLFYDMLVFSINGEKRQDPMGYGERSAYLPLWTI